MNNFKVFLDVFLGNQFAFVGRFSVGLPLLNHCVEVVLYTLAVCKSCKRPGIDILKKLISGQNSSGNELFAAFSFLSAQERVRKWPPHNVSKITLDVALCAHFLPMPTTGRHVVDPACTLFYSSQLLTTSDRPS